MNIVDNTERFMDRGQKKWNSMTMKERFLMMVTKEDLICRKEMVLKEGFSSYSPELTSYNKNKIIC